MRQIVLSYEILLLDRKDLTQTERPGVRASVEPMSVLRWENLLKTAARWKLGFGRVLTNLVLSPEHSLEGIVLVINHLIVC